MNRFEEMLFTSMTVRRWCLLTLLVAVGFGAIGWFAGREYMAHQIRSALVDATASVGLNLQRDLAAATAENQKISDQINKQQKAMDDSYRAGQSLADKKNEAEKSERLEISQYVENFRSLKNDPKFQGVVFVAGHVGVLPPGTVDVSDGFGQLDVHHRAMMMQAFHEVFH